MIKAVIFDMDGTILDTITDITTASNNALEAMGLPHHFTRDEVKLCFGSGIHDDIAKIIALARGCQGQDLIDLCETIPASRYAVTEEEIQKCRAIFSDLYPRNHRKTSPYEGIPELLKKLREKGIKTAVASNKDEAPVKKLTEMYIKGLFDVVKGNKTGYPPKTRSRHDQCNPERSFPHTRGCHLRRRHRSGHRNSQKLPPPLPLRHLGLPPRNLPQSQRRKTLREPSLGNTGFRGKRIKKGTPQHKRCCGVF